MNLHLIKIQILLDLEVYLFKLGGIFGRQESDNLMVFMRDYSGLNFNNENISSILF